MPSYIACWQPTCHWQMPSTAQKSVWTYFYFKTIRFPKHLTSCKVVFPVKFQEEKQSLTLLNQLVRTTAVKPVRGTKRCLRVPFVSHHSEIHTGGKLQHKSWHNDVCRNMLSNCTCRSIPTSTCDGKTFPFWYSFPWLNKRDLLFIACGAMAANKIYFPWQLLLVKVLISIHQEATHIESVWNLPTVIQ